ncbi:MAG: hypothetical protein GC160_02935 [Acidobacteria bacterium]|nr:hypothetical protein [Acidobacteriota bacterium]
MKLQLKKGAQPVRHRRAGIELHFEPGKPVDLLVVLVEPAFEGALAAAGGDLKKADLRGVDAILKRAPALCRELLKKLPVELLDEMPVELGLEDVITLEAVEPERPAPAKPAKAKAAKEGEDA